MTGVLPRSTASSSETAISELCRHYKTSMPRSWSSRNPKRGTLRWRWSCSRRAASTPLPSTRTWIPIPAFSATTSVTLANSSCRSACSLHWTACSTASSETENSVKIHGYADHYRFILAAVHILKHSGCGLEGHAILRGTAAKQNSDLQSFHCSACLSAKYSSKHSPFSYISVAASTPTYR